MFNITTLWTVVNSFRQSIQKCELTKRFENGPILSPQGLNGTAPQSLLVWRWGLGRGFSLIQHALVDLTSALALRGILTFMTSVIPFPWKTQVKFLRSTLWGLREGVIGDGNSALMINRCVLQFLVISMMMSESCWFTVFKTDVCGWNKHKSANAINNILIIKVGVIMLKFTWKSVVIRAP